MTTRVVAEITWIKSPDAISAAAKVRAEAAVTKALADIEGVAKTLVRVDTGNLKNSIATAKETPLRGTVGPRDVDYAMYQEYGTYKMLGKPYMRPAAEYERPIFLEAMRQIAAL